MISANHIHLLLSAVLTVLCLDISLEAYPQAAPYVVSTLALLGAQTTFFDNPPARPGNNTRIRRAERFLGLVRLLDDTARSLPNTGTLVAALRVLRLYSELGVSAFLLPAGTGFNRLFTKLLRIRASQRSGNIGPSAPLSDVVVLGPRRGRQTPRAR